MDGNQGGKYRTFRTQGDIVACGESIDCGRMQWDQLPFRRGQELHCEGRLAAPSRLAKRDHFQ
jgi:hypothetical protein